MQSLLTVSYLSMLAACQPRPFEEDRLPVALAEGRPIYVTYDASYDTVWEALVEVVGDIAPIEVIDQTRGVIETDWMYGFSDYIFKSYSGTRIPEPIRTRWDATVTASSSGRTRVEVVAREEIEKDMISANLEFRGRVYEWIEIPSSTEKERALFAQVEQVMESRVTADYDY